MWTDLRYLFRYRLYGWFQRANRGWADHDTWSFDTYLSRIIAGGLRELVKRNMGYPSEFPGGAEAWEAWLHDKADWFEWYADWRKPFDGQKHDTFFNEVLPDFVKHFGELWD